MQVVVIGANACGAKSACRVKRLNPKAEVILIDKDDLISYGPVGYLILFQVIFPMKML